MDQPTSMRCQATALMTLPEKLALESSAERHKTGLTVILRAGFRCFDSLPHDIQAAWIEDAKQEAKQNA